MTKKINLFWARRQRRLAQRYRGGVRGGVLANSKKRLVGRLKCLRKLLDRFSRNFQGWCSYSPIAFSTWLKKFFSKFWENNCQNFEKMRFFGFLKLKYLFYAKFLELNYEVEKSRAQKVATKFWLLKFFFLIFSKKQKKTLFRECLSLNNFTTGQFMNYAMK